MTQQATPTKKFKTDYKAKKQPTVVSKFGTEKDTMPKMTAEAVKAQQEIAEMLEGCTKAQRQAVYEVLQRVYDVKTVAGSKRIIGLTIPTLLMSASKPN